MVAYQNGLNNIDESNQKSLCAPGSYLRSGTWWIGILLMVLGEAGNFVAYGFAPASVVAPLGKLQFIFLEKLVIR